MKTDFNAFMKQFKLSPIQNIGLEKFIFHMADKMVTGYSGGNWESTKVGQTTILLLPSAPGEEVTLLNANAGTSITTDRLTASAAFTALVVNWYWNINHSQLSDASNDEFSTYYHGLRNDVYSDTPTHAINTDDYFTFTD